MHRSRLSHSSFTELNRLQETSHVLLSSEREQRRGAALKRCALPYLSKMDAGKQSSSSTWSWEENKKFEVALLQYIGNHPISIPWDKIAAGLPGRTVDEIKAHYDELVEDICRIDPYALSLPDCDLPEESAAGGSDGNKGSADEPRRDQGEIKSAAESNPGQSINTSNTHQTFSA
ncbi:hypothetical protein OPV22_005572 [Ensete ventricosum]|uniref:Myb-like domain-containing protein n=1 Tax=Ensete ventricosum TaxID=4639 RepID=A0AAV8Q370_ENSVE|nr:hypothetical protein OPV22_005572 [Ensete ventricosum]